MQSDRTSARDQKCSIFSLHRPDNAVASAKKSACGQVSPYPDGSAISVWRRQPVPERARLSRPRSSHSYASAVFAMGLLPRRGAQAVPGVADLVVMDLGRIVRSIEGERLDIEPA